MTRGRIWLVGIAGFALQTLVAVSLVIGAMTLADRTPPLADPSTRADASPSPSPSPSRPLVVPTRPNVTDVLAAAATARAATDLPTGGSFGSPVVIEGVAAVHVRAPLLVDDRPVIGVHARTSATLSDMRSQALPALAPREEWVDAGGPVDPAVLAALLADALGPTTVDATLRAWERDEDGFPRAVTVVTATIDGGPWSVVVDESSLSVSRADPIEASSVETACGEVSDPGLCVYAPNIREARTTGPSGTFRPVPARELGNDGLSGRYVRVTAAPFGDAIRTAWLDTPAAALPAWPAGDDDHVWAEAGGTELAAQMSYYWLTDGALRMSELGVGSLPTEPVLVVPYVDTDPNATAYLDRSITIKSRSTDTTYGHDATVLLHEYGHVLFASALQGHSGGVDGSLVNEVTADVFALLQTVRLGLDDPTCMGGARTGTCLRRMEVAEVPSGATVYDRGNPLRSALWDAYASSAPDRGRACLSGSCVDQADRFLQIIAEAWAGVAADAPWLGPVNTRMGIYDVSVPAFTTAVLQGAEDLGLTEERALLVDRLRTADVATSVHATVTMVGASDTAPVDLSLVVRDPSGAVLCTLPTVTTTTAATTIDAAGCLTQHPPTSQRVWELTATPTTEAGATIVELVVALDAGDDGASSGARARPATTADPAVVTVPADSRLAPEDGRWLLDLGTAAGPVVAVDGTTAAVVVDTGGGLEVVLLDATSGTIRSRSSYVHQSQLKGRTPRFVVVAGLVVHPSGNRDAPTLQALSPDGRVKWAVAVGTAGGIRDVTSCDDAVCTIEDRDGGRRRVRRSMSDGRELDITDAAGAESLLNLGDDRLYALASDGGRPRLDAVTPGGGTVWSVDLSSASADLGGPAQVSMGRSWQVALVGDQLVVELGGSGGGLFDDRIDPVVMALSASDGAGQWVKTGVVLSDLVSPGPDGVTVVRGEHDDGLFSDGSVTVLGYDRLDPRTGRVLATTGIEWSNLDDRECWSADLRRVFRLDAGGWVGHDLRRDRAVAGPSAPVIWCTRNATDATRQQRYASQTAPLASDGAPVAGAIPPSWVATTVGPWALYVAGDGHVTGVRTD